jgi:hypothetical protein
MAISTRSTNFGTNSVSHNFFNAMAVLNLTRLVALGVPSAAA